MTDPYSIRMPPDIQSVMVGDHQLVFIDDFLEHPEALLDAACQSTFEPTPGFEERKGYPGVRATAPAEYSSELNGLLDPLIRLNFQVPEHLGVHKSACSFSLTTVPPDHLGPLQRTPHFDSSTPHHMAVLLYLCGPEHGGTGFYRHRATGLQQITPETLDRYSDAYCGEIERVPPPPRYFDDSDEHFSFLGMIPARFNRLVVYSGSLLHTACINPGLSISSDPRQGRLTVNTFYDFF
ncbi:DUF6445 family protein [Roseateles toxinivorans]|uniref:2-oxoglutarate-Fe(II)-dependent oxygenase superfamily protein n=1 Tax=Roseateles toxinivorans TaxID=270368 RepID=A0A4R6QH88_9BURK|nr:DUF6445 family protein [Roseateles toxinivorans]TDP62423.1 hypothetical protein DES47_1071 [Roseateles toxinivorans]